MKDRLKRWARWLVYPTFYVACLAVFGYLSFPYDKLKDRVIAEFDRAQQKSQRRGKASGDPMRLEIAEIDSHWLTGVELVGAKLTLPPKKPSKAATMMAFTGGGDKDKAPPKPSVIQIDRATVRVRILPLLIGDVMIDFHLEALGGTIDGSAPVGSEGDVEVELAGLQLNDLGPLRDMVEGLPILGVVGGSVRLTPKEGKFGKADGKLELRIDEVVIGDGVTKVLGFALPGAQVGQIAIDATITDGLLTIDEMTAHGRDFELVGEGKVKLHESWDRAQADFFLKFKFADGYRNKNETTKGLLGDSEGKIKPAIELLATSPFRRAKTEDGFYRFQFSGPLGNLEPKPAAIGSSKAGDAKAKGPRMPKVGRTDRGGTPRPRDEEGRGEAPPQPTPAPPEADRTPNAAPPGADTPQPEEVKAEGEGEAPEGGAQ